MKKLALFIMSALMFILFIPMQMIAATESGQTSSAVTNSTGSKEADVFLSRLNSISQMNFSTLSLSERRELRNEVKSIKSELKSLDGGVYLSVGAIIIILLILILLL